MNFSELFQLSSLRPNVSTPSKGEHPIVKYSPDGRWIANAVQYRLIVRDANDELQVRHLFTCVDAVTSLSWSPDSRLLMAVMPKRAVIQIWALDQPDWSCKIDEGSAGLAWARWSPDSLHVLTMADFNVRVTVWSLASKAVAYLKHVSKAGEKGIAFSWDGKYLAFAERRDCKDALSIFDCSSSSSWNLVKHFSLPTKELAGLEWKPGGCESIVIWESIIFGVDVLLYALNGDQLARFTNENFVGSLTQKSRITSLGISKVIFSPCGQLATLCCSDPFVSSFVLLNTLTWSRIVEFQMTTTIVVGSENKSGQNDMNENPVYENAIIYKEVTKKVPVNLSGNHRLATADVASLGTLYANRSRYESSTSGVTTIPTITFDPDKVLPSLLILTSFSPDSSFLATKTEAMPNAVWIWSIRKLSLVSLLLHSSSVKSFSWAPNHNQTCARLSVVTGNINLYMWTPKGALVVQVPSDVAMDVNLASWSPDGASMALVGQDAFALCFCQTEDHPEADI